MRHWMTSGLLVACFALNTSLYVHAQEAAPSGAGPGADLSQGLEELLNMTTAVASKKETGARATPGVVTIITADEIRNMGARDLIDVLSTVPSLNFGLDVQGVVGLGVRGMWAHEGKMLLVIDGIEMNEIQYGTTQFGNRYPVDQIRRIEIIRGPGSAIYGGFAELAVVNIITKSGSELAGARAQYTYGRMKEGSERNNLSASFGRKSGDWEYSVAGYLGSAVRGEGTYSGTDGTISGNFEMADADRLEPHYLNAGLSNGNFKFRFLYDEYHLSSQSQFNYTGVNFAMPNEFRSTNFAASYALKLGENTTITPYAHYYMQNPWRQESEESLNYTQTSNINSYRFKAGTAVSHDVSEKLNLLAGYEYIRDRNLIKDRRNPTGPLGFQNGGEEFSLYSHALLAQALYQASFANFTLGARFEDPSRTESSFVPRFAITRAEKLWHGKFLFSNAFRSPVLYNISLEPNIKPEKTQTVEMEGGYATSDTTYFTAGVFHTKIQDPIIYTVDSSLVEHYGNFGDVATKGIELNWQLKMERARLQVGYTYYEVDANGVPSYAVMASDDALMGMPQHKAVLNGTAFLNADQDLKLNSTLIWVGERYAELTDEANNVVYEAKLDARVILNTYLSKENLFLPGLSGGLGVYNLLDAEDSFVQPYRSGHSPLPGPSREVFARIEYRLGF